jgi:hypothetical protein
MLVVTTIFLWTAALILGFALIDTPAVLHGEFARSTHANAFLVALWFSSAAFSSLSFSDVEPRTLPYHTSAAVETVLGLAVLTLSITYVLNLYGALQRQGERVTRLQHRTPDPSDPRTLLEPHFPDGEQQGVSDLLRELHEMLTAQAEAIRRYPVLYYFHARTAYRSLPYLFWFVGATAATLRWGLPTDHPATRNPWLPGLLHGYQQVTDQVRERFVGTDQQFTQPQIVDPGTFNDADADDPLLSDFRQMEAFMTRVARIDKTDHDDSRYRRYREWAMFASRGRAFVDAATEDLGLPIQSLHERPSAQLF